MDEFRQAAAAVAADTSAAVRPAYPDTRLDSTGLCTTSCRWYIAFTTERFVT